MMRVAIFFTSGFLMMSPGQILFNGGSSGIGFETARGARVEGAKVILTARNTKRLHHAYQDETAIVSATNRA